MTTSVSKITGIYTIADIESAIYSQPFLIVCYDFLSAIIEINYISRSCDGWKSRCRSNTIRWKNWASPVVFI